MAALVKKYDVHAINYDLFADLEELIDTFNRVLRFAEFGCLKARFI